MKTELIHRYVAYRNTSYGDRQAFLREQIVDYTGRWKIINQNGAIFLQLEVFTLHSYDKLDFEDYDVEIGFLWWRRIITRRRKVNKKGVKAKVRWANEKELTLIYSEEIINECRTCR